MTAATPSPEPPVEAEGDRRSEQATARRHQTVYRVLTFVAVAGMTLLIAAEMSRPRYDFRPDPRDGFGPPSKEDPTRDLRLGASNALDAKKWSLALELLGRARELNPSIEDAGPIRSARELAERMLDREYMDDPHGEGGARDSDPGSEASTTSVRDR